jgi:hypothetical protein
VTPKLSRHRWHSFLPLREFDQQLGLFFGPFAGFFRPHCCPHSEDQNLHQLRLRFGRDGGERPSPLRPNTLPASWDRLTKGSNEVFRLAHSRHSLSGNGLTSGSSKTTTTGTIFSSSGFPADRTPRAVCPASSPAAGVLKPGGPLSIKQLYDRYRLGLTVPSIERLLNHPPKNPALEEDWLVRYSRFVNIKFLGVFDTVGSLGVPVGISRFKKSHAFLNTSLRTPNVAAAHALAIDEHRPDFAPTLWTRSVPKDPNADQPRAPRSLAEAEQRWFVGAHASVGGGYSNDLLSQRPFAWMMKRAAAQGLSFRSDVDQFSPTIRSPVIDSYGSFLGGFYRYLQRELATHRGPHRVPQSFEMGGPDVHGDAEAEKDDAVEVKLDGSAWHIEESQTAHLRQRQPMEER